MTDESRVVPAEEDLRMFARILLHLGRWPRFQLGETVPPSLTQEGIAQQLGTSRAAVSNALLRLVSAGAVESRRAHVTGKPLRLKVYQLTTRGEEAARHIRESMDRIGSKPPSLAQPVPSWGTAFSPSPE